MAQRKKILIVGSGVAGLGAAWALRDSAEVVVLEADAHIGGHADTVDVDFDGSAVPVDMGFIVYNEITYPHMIRWFDQLGVPTAASDMSFALSSPGYEYSGSARGLFGGRNALRPDTWKLARSILRFRDVARSHLDDKRPIGRFVDEMGFPAVFRDRYLLPMAAAIWSSPHTAAAEMPAGTLLRFFDQHQLLDVTGRPTWKTVLGGSREYVARAVADSGADVSVGTPVARFERSAAGVVATTRAGDRHTADEAVFACHADTTLELLGDGATGPERALLSQFGFAMNRAVMHSDPTLMPRAKRTWSAWNVLASERDQPVTVTYWMNRLQPLPTERDVFVTLNPPVKPSVVHHVTNYSHPMFDPNAVQAQLDLAAIQGQSQAWFCGAWTGYGFHEDGLESGFAVGRALGGDVPWWDDVVPHSQSARIADKAGVLA